MLTPEFLRTRHSVRRFSGRPIDAKTVNAVKAAITMVNTHEAGMHFELVTDDPTPFKGFKANYGMLHGVRNYISAVADLSFPDARERAGYFAEDIVMKCVGLGLGTCFVGGTYDATQVKTILRIDRKILFLIALGYAAEKIQTPISAAAMKFIHLHDRTPADFFVAAEGIEFEEACSRMPWMLDGLRGLASAPSSLNKQPVRVSPRFMPDGNLTVAAFTTGSKNNPIDLGIGKYNFAQAADGEWEWGEKGIFYKQ